MKTKALIRYAFRDAAGIKHALQSTNANQTLFNSKLSPTSFNAFSKRLSDVINDISFVLRKMFHLYVNNGGTDQSAHLITRCYTYILTKILYKT